MQTKNVQLVTYADCVSAIKMFSEVSVHTAGRVYRFSRYMHTANGLITIPYNFCPEFFVN